MFGYDDLAWSLGQTPQEVRAKLPACYSQEFDDCITEVDAARQENRPLRETPYCAPYIAVIRDTPNPVFADALKLVPYCGERPAILTEITNLVNSVAERREAGVKKLNTGAIIGGAVAGGIVGFILGMLVKR